MNIFAAENKSHPFGNLVLFSGTYLQSVLYFEDSAAVDAGADFWGND